MAQMLERADQMTDQEIEEIGTKAKERIDKYYSWEYITQRYEELFTK